MTPQGIAAIVSMTRDATPEEILGRCRYPHIVSARHAAWKLAYVSGWDKARIAREFNVNFTSVKYGLDKAK